MKIVGVIPARYASTRFPGKPLAIIDGKSMIRRVYEQAMKCSGLMKVIVATDHEAIANHVRTFGGEVRMTGSHHGSGTERCNEVAEQLRSEGEEFDYVINIQGDEPFIAPQQIGQLITGLLDDKPPIATMVKKIDNTADLQSSNVVKVAIDQHGFAMLFSRSPVPYVRDHPPSDWIKVTDFFKHLGIYAYKSSILREIVALPPTGLECAESLEQLRWLGNGYPIMTYQTEYESIAIDVPSDLLKITNRF